MLVGLQFDQARFERELGNMDRSIQMAAVITLTKVAGEIRQAEVGEMRSIFDRPTPWVLNSLFVRPATPEDPTAEVGVKDARAAGELPAAKNLEAEVEGGGRRLKRSERALQRIGLLPAGTMMVPGAGARLDAYGNIDKGQLVQILAALKAFVAEGTGRRRNRVGKSRMKAGGQRYGQDYFALTARRGRLEPGVYLRTQTGFGSSVVPVIRFVRPASYQAVFRFEDVARRVAAERAQEHFRDQVAQSVARRLARSFT